MPASEAKEAERLGYELRFEDGLAFSEQLYMDSPRLQAARRSQRWIWPIVFIVLAAWRISANGLDLASAVLILFAVAWAGLTPLLYRWWHRRQYKRAFSLGTARDLLGPTTLTADEKGLEQRTAVIENELGWDSIQRVVTTPQHAFLYTGPDQAIIIPRETVTEGDFERFVATVRRRSDQKRSS